MSDGGEAARKAATEIRLAKKLAAEKQERNRRMEAGELVLVDENGYYSEAQLLVEEQMKKDVE